MKASAWQPHAKHSQGQKNFDNDAGRAASCVNAIKVGRMQPRCDISEAICIGDHLGAAFNICLYIIYIYIILYKGF